MDKDAVRAVKEKAMKLMARFGQVSGVGITRRKGRYAVSVLMEDEPSGEIPQEIDGVPLVVRVVGKIRAQEVSSGQEGV